MTAQEHIVQAERFMAIAAKQAELEPAFGQRKRRALNLSAAVAAAQVHATLAIAVAKLED